MSFREKSAWITLITLIAVALFGGLHLPPWVFLDPEPSLFLFHVLTAGVVAFLVISIVAHAVVVLRAPRDARAPKDERERLISLKATNIAAKVYVLLSMGSILLVHAGASGLGVAWGVLFSFVIAQIVNYAARVVYYRRGV